MTPPRHRSSGARRRDVPDGMAPTLQQREAWRVWTLRNGCFETGRRDTGGAPGGANVDMTLERETTEVRVSSMPQPTATR